MLCTGIIVERYCSAIQRSRSVREATGSARVCQDRLALAPVGLPPSIDLPGYSRY